MYDKCKIDCSFIGLRSGICDLFRECRINTTNGSRVFLIYDKNSSIMGYDFKVLNCKILNSGTRVFDSKTRNKINLKCRIVGNTLSSKDLTLLSSKYNAVEYY